MSEAQQLYWDNQTQKTGYCESFLKVAKANNWLGMIKKSIKKTKSNDFNNILEIGGGSQLLSRYFCENYPNARVVCTDISADRIDIFQGYYNNKPNNLTMMGNVNAEKLPFKDGEFDLIIGDAVVSHFEDSKRGFLEINRCLKKGGHAIFIREPVIGVLGLFAYRFLQMINKEGDHVKKNRFEYKRMLSQWIYEFIMTGFKVKVIGGWGIHPLTDKIRSAFPQIFPCHICFILEKKFDLLRDVK